ncbi:hypothetical protein [Pseudoduganella umbonata]|uniref:Integrase n=1 Tax=Pseudoduganella umbonata TaxID=864828 RepID=A0A4P8HSX4_9BURK|nr:hypothetical protein [Pseudoduganella umbonata]MBB3222117.1 hypothetical protein [Pseudoduganella umbonata]QCP12356.1 hypothetical protein FCL38_19470 [Pseudoduganella umbonata]
MNKTLLFKSRADLTAEENLAAFVRYCRMNLVLFGGDLAFDEDIWDITETYPVKGATKRNRAYFSSYEAAKAQRYAPAMSPQFKDFAKAYFRYSLSLRSSSAWANRIAALRALDHALVLEGQEGRITRATHDTFVRACSIIQQGYASITAPKIAGQLSEICDLVVRLGFCQMKTPWKSTLKRSQDSGTRVGVEAEKARDEKLPSKAAIEALAYIFQNPETPAERIVTSAVALMYCFPQRINEVVRLPYNCEVEYDAENNPNYGLRESGSKGFQDSVRWVLETMEPVARKAIANLKEASREARKVAAWYEQNPGKIYLKPEYEYLREQQYVNLDEVGLMLYGLPRQVLFWTDEKGSKFKFPKICSFSYIEQLVLRKLPPDLLRPSPNLKYSESLFIALRFELNAKIMPYCCIVERVSPGEITSRLTSSGTARSFFENRGYTDTDGKPLEMKSHQARHYLNTLAQSNGASQLDIAMWSGRADPSQNSTYDHVTPSELLSKTKAIALAGKSQLFAGVTDIPKIRVVAHRDDATGRLITGTAHATLYGMCRHDFAASPCPIHRDCLNCHEHICVKGAHVKLANIKRMHDETEGLLTKAEAAEGQAKYGASRWVSHHRQTLEHCKQLISILDSTVIADGALVALNDVVSASKVEQVKFLREEKSGQPRQNRLLERLRNGKK